MADVVSEFFVKTLAESSALSTVEGRVWDSEPPVSQNTPLVYPMVIFEMSEGIRDRYVPYERYFASVHFLSSVSFAECRQLYEAARPLLDKSYTTTDGRNFNINEVAVPTQTSGTSPQPTYAVSSRFYIQVLG